MGQLLAALGNLRDAQGRAEDSLAAHRRALNVYTKNFGSHNLNASNAAYKVADQLYRQNGHSEALYVENRLL